MEIATIGFTQSSAEHFFDRLRAAGIRRILDIRLHNSSQLAGFAKGSDLAYFAEAILDASYEHDLRLAPTEDILTAYRGRKIPAEAFEAAVRDLLRSRDVPAVLDRAAFASAKTVLLCSEPKPQHCHRRVVADLLAGAWGATIHHL